MALSPEQIPWWDRESDQRGKRIRADVREAARKIWARTCAQAKAILGDATEAAELLESVVQSISGYLNKRNLPPQDPSGLLVVAFRRSARRLARRRGRIEGIGGTSDLAELLQTPAWTEEVERSLLLEQIVARLSERNRGIVRLRLAGYGWNEIARILQTTPLAARNSFWHGIHKARMSLSQAPGRRTRAS